MRVEGRTVDSPRPPQPDAADLTAVDRERERERGARPLRLFTRGPRRRPIGHIIHFIKPVFDFPPRFQIGRGFKERSGRQIDAVQKSSRLKVGCSAASTLLAPTVELMDVLLGFLFTYFARAVACLCVCVCMCVRVVVKVMTASACVPDNAAPWDARPSASPSLSEVAPPIDSLSMSSPSSHLAPDPPHLPPLDVPRDLAAGDGRMERSKSPQKPELLSPDPTGQGRRAPSAGGSGRAKRDGGRSTHKGHRVQPASEGDGGKEEAKTSRSSRGRSKERNSGVSRESTRSPSNPLLPHANGSNREDVERHIGGGGHLQQGDSEPIHPRSREPERGLGESRPSLPHKSTSSSSSAAAAAGRKTTVSPGPWKIPGSDKLPSTLRTGASTLSR